MDRNRMAFTALLLASFTRSSLLQISDAQNGSTAIHGAEHPNR